MPKVSVCIPAYNQVKYLKRTIDSILTQNYTNYEIIITDDSPSNIVSDLIKNYELPDKIKYFKNKRALGSPENWNEALRKASGEYIKILHHDDWFTTDFSLGEFVNMLEKNPNANFAFSAAVAINIKNKRTWIHSATVAQLDSLRKNSEILFLGNFIGPPSSTIHRRNDKICYDKNLKWVVDFDYYIQNLNLKNNEFVFSDTPLITSISGELHNVTNECENNKDVEIFEYLYLFNKVKNNNKKLKNAQIGFLQMLFARYNIKSIKEIRETGYDGALPWRIHISFLTKKIRNVFKKV